MAHVPWLYQRKDRLLSRREREARAQLWKAAREVSGGRPDRTIGGTVGPLLLATGGAAVVWALVRWLR